MKEKLGTIVVILVALKTVNFYSLSILDYALLIVIATWLVVSIYTKKNKED